ncbi:hypothetical protein SAMN06295974_2001 [Plantibacter flavus]|uniref:Glycosyltransferase n=1 Tax=Plantibacter flavus TaxID=150123 RepID=A0A3N2BXW5_9MICO|nr:DUF2064 domain-containing protein [Plantibacter flavus]ROR80105.1 hypothetical protein EDD42_0138 [Plantibacter flavus]SMG29371.1 hypothetical protein SAMN06295974_2001 [Plantibacter flavus]
MTTIVLIAKEPVAGRVKTRLHPPFTLVEAASLAAAAIDDTLRVLGEVPATKRVLFYQGTTLPARARGFDVVPQPEGTLDERLGWLFDRYDTPVLLVGMDTPQLQSGHLAGPCTDWPDDVDSWFGPAEDGGFWALGMREPDGALIRGVAMSQDDTGARQLDRLRAAGHRVGMLPTLRDVDTAADADVVATVAPRTAFSERLRELRAGGRPPEGR